MSIFSQQPAPRLSHSTFDLSHEKHLTCHFGALVPVLCEEVLPGDHFKMSCEAHVRLAPMLAPAFSRVNVFFHYFYVPNRLIWAGWELFIRGEESTNPAIGNNATPAPIPTVPAINLQNGIADNSFFTNNPGWIAPGSLMDYMGLAVNSAYSGSTIASLAYPWFSALPFRAYQRIWNDFYRDEDLQPSIFAEENVRVGSANSWTMINIPTPIPIINIGPFPTPKAILMTQSYQLQYPNLSEGRVQLALLMALRYRNWPKDYFTSASYDTQKGGDVVIADVASEIDVYRKSLTTHPLATEQIRMGGSGNPGPQTLMLGNVGQDTIPANTWLPIGTSSLGTAVSRPAAIDPNGAWAASVRVPIFVTTLRRAFALQRFFERSMRGGNRYIEMVKAHFGVDVSDARLDRPEFLGGYSLPVKVGEVVSTSSGESQLGTVSAATPFGVAAGSGKGKFISRKFTDYGYVFCLMSILPKQMYIIHGVPKQLRHGAATGNSYDQGRFDFFWPEFQHIGEQEIRIGELLVNPSSSATFGYTPRYAEYKSRIGTVHGSFRPIFTGSGAGSGHLSHWTSARFFGDGVPQLNENFIKFDSTTSTDRLFVVDDQSGNSDTHKCWIQLYNHVYATRKMDYYGEPK